MLKKVVRKASEMAYKLQSSAQLDKLLQEIDPQAQQLGQAIKATFSKTISPEEQPFIERIEALRHQMETSDESMTVMDFGAGKRTDTLTDEEMYQGRTKTLTVAAACSHSKPPEWALLLFKLVREFKPKALVEMGTNVGISASYQASALKLNGDGGRLMTLEGAEALADLSQRNFHSLGLDNVRCVVGRFQDTLDGVLEELRPLDYAFIDGHHEEKATINYFHQILPYTAPTALMIFDDINWNEGMHNAWETIIAHERVDLAVEMEEIGICVVRPTKVSTKRLYKIY
ncbi:MAG: class I SAM-dependent methyltransferase [bacterium]|nr:class I SAM-dependent methyltransferase [bacterium]